MNSKIHYRYVYENNGTIAPQAIPPNDIWIDTGNALRDGIFDHHQTGGYNSSFESIMSETAYFDGLKKYLSDHLGEECEVVFHIHKYPDTDCISSVFAVQQMIEKGTETPREALGRPVADLLTEYVNTIDNGIKKIIKNVTLYAYFCNIGRDISDPSERSKAMLTEGLRVMSFAVPALENDLRKPDREIDLFYTTVDKYIDTACLNEYEGLAELLYAANKKCYQEDKDNNRVILKYINVWNKETRQNEAVYSAVWAAPPGAEDQYIWAREEDKCMLTVYPYFNKDGKTVNRVVIALNPALNTNYKYSLLPLAEVIEMCEQAEEDLEYRTSGRYRRDHSRPRDYEGILSKIPFSATSDPWFISKEEDIIDVPRSGFYLSYEAICSLLDNTSSTVKKASLIRFKAGKDGISIAETLSPSGISFGDLYSLTEQRLRSIYTAAYNDQDDSQYLLAVIRVDASMIKYSNRILKSCCLNMIGKSESEMNEDNLLYLDYRTCLYADQSAAIIVMADSSNPAMEQLMGGPLENTWLCSDIKNILARRQELRSIGTALTELIQKTKKRQDRINDLNSRVIRLITMMQKDDLIMDPVGQEIHGFVKNCLGIEAMKESVTSSAELLIQNAQQTSDNQIQSVMGVFALLAIFSALIDGFDFITRFDVNGDWYNLSRCFQMLELAVMAVIGFVSILAIWFAVKAIRAAGFSFRKENKK